MKFDKRISSDLRDVYTLYCRNNDNLLGIEVYASNDIDDFNDLDQCKKGKVDYIDPVHGYSVKIDSENTCYFNFVIPASAVKEKTLRPYTLEEFQLEFDIGKPITFRRKNISESEKYLIYLGYSWDEIEHTYYEHIQIGNSSYSLKELFENYEWQASDTEEFKPFGVAV
jgi:hypothetical protein